MLRTATLLFVLLLVVSSTTIHAGKNAGGALIVHTQALGTVPSYCYGLGYDPCEDTEECFPDPASCVDAETEAPIDPLMGSIVWFYAAFPENADPGVTVIYFGHDHNLPAGYLAGWGFCGPAGSLEIPDTGWPSDPNAGNSLAFGEPVAGNHLIRVYWFGVYGEAGFYHGTTANPTGGYAAFVSDDNPGGLDEIHLFGQVLWGEPGFNECPEPLVAGACCFDDGGCEPLYEYQCFEAGGIEWISGEACEPENPCTPTAAEWTTWGALKTDHR